MGVFPSKVEHQPSSQDHQDRWAATASVARPALGSGSGGCFETRVAWCCPSFFGQTLSVLDPRFLKWPGLRPQRWCVCVRGKPVSQWENYHRKSGNGPFPTWCSELLCSVKLRNMVKSSAILVKSQVTVTGQLLWNLPFHGRSRWFLLQGDSLEDEKSGRQAIQQLLVVMSN